MFSVHFIFIQRASLHFRAIAMAAILFFSLALINVQANADEAQTGGVIDINDAKVDAVNFAIVSDTHSINFSGHSDQLNRVRQLRKLYALPFVWFKQQGQEYIVTDAHTVTTFQSYWAALQPHEEKIRKIEQKIKPFEESLQQLSEEMQSLVDDREFDSPAMRSVERQMQTESKQIQKLSAGIEAMSEQIEQLSEKAQQQTKELINVTIEKQLANKL